MAKDLDQTLADRKNTYGDYPGKAAFIQAVKAQMRAAPSWGKCTPAMQESLDMDIHKTARILWGEPAHLDNWVDKLGYIQLAVDEFMCQPYPQTEPASPPSAWEPGDLIPLAQERGVQFRNDGHPVIGEEYNLSSGCKDPVKKKEWTEEEYWGWMGC